MHGFGGCHQPEACGAELCRLFVYLSPVTGLHALDELVVVPCNDAEALIQPDKASALVLSGVPFQRQKKLLFCAVEIVFRYQMPDREWLCHVNPLS